MGMMPSSLIFLVCVVVLMNAAAAGPCYEGAFQDRQEFPWCMQLSPKVAMHWQLTDKDVTVGFEVEQVGGWMGIGVSEGSGGMPGSDLWVVSKDAATGTFSVSDTYASQFEQPVTDRSQDVELLSVVEKNGVTSAKLKRALQPCDFEEDNRIYRNETHVWLWAYSLDVWPTMHEPTTRGFAAFVLDKPRRTVMTSSSKSKEDIETIDVRLPNVLLPNETNAYWCKNFKMPLKKRHIVKIEYVTNPHKVVHHISMFGCYRKPSMSKEEYPLIPGREKEEVYNCVFTGTPPAECAAWLINWLPGQGPLEFPPEAGMAIGKGGWEYLALQVHYNSISVPPEEIAGQRDSSGLILHTTTNLRPHDMGLLWVGSTDITIPPAMKAYTIPPGVCPSECTAKFKAPLVVPWHSPHMHLIGSSFDSYHLRLASNGRDLEEIAPLNVRKHYAYLFQGTTFVFPESNTILPGDALITRCTYNSLQRTNVTLGGEGSADEMCYNFVNYYPRQEVEMCQPYLSYARGSKDMAFAYCASALNRSTFEEEVGQIPAPAKIETWTEAQFRAWADKNLLPVFEKYMKLGVIVEYNLTRHMESFGKKKLSELLQCSKRDNSALQLTYAVDGSKASENAGNSSGRTSAGSSAAVDTGSRVRVALRVACIHAAWAGFVLLGMMMV